MNYLVESLEAASWCSAAQMVARVEEHIVGVDHNYSMEIIGKGLGHGSGGGYR